ncbi:23530_t:CDS:2, partial [Cetraspora pellucida]
SVKEESNLTHIWAIGIYSVKSEDCKIEIVLFIPINDHDRNPNTQSVFVKNEYFSIGEKMTVALSTHLTIRKDPGSNRCSLKVSLVGTIQDAAQEVNNKNFKHLMNSIRSDVSVLFIIVQMEVIQGDLYMYAIETSFVNAYFVDKNEGLYKLVQSRLLSAYQNVSRKFSKTSIENNNKCAEINQTTIDLSISIEDEDSEHMGSDYIENECLVKDNKVYVDEGNKLVRCVINENVKKNCSEEDNGSGRNAINVSRKRGWSKK